MILRAVKRHNAETEAKPYSGASPSSPAPVGSAGKPRDVPEDGGSTGSPKKGSPKKKRAEAGEAVKQEALYDGRSHYRVRNIDWYVPVNFELQKWLGGGTYGQASPPSSMHPFIAPPGVQGPGRAAPCRSQAHG